MSATPPPGYTPPPTDLPIRGDRATFSSRVDAWVTWFSTVILTQLAAMVANAYANALDAYASATAALGYRDTANTAATAAQGYRDTARAYRDAAATSATDAATSATDAATSATASAASAVSLTATSTSSVALGSGTKNFVIAAGKQMPPGELLQIVSTGTPAARMFGTVATYTGTALSVAVTQSEGPAGTYNDWVIAPGGAQGPPGGTAGGQLTSALDEKKGTAPASSTTPDIWSAGGNYVPITSTTTITGFPNAPQAGARRTLIAQADFTLTSGANLVVRGGTRIVQNGDEVEVVADTASTFHATIKRGSGRAVSALVFTRAELMLSSGTFTAKITGPHRVYLVGPGGSGAVVGSASGSGVTVSATGAAAGGLAIKDFDAVAGANYAFAAGAPGAAPTGNLNNGNAGSASTFTGAGVSLTCNGGNGGTYSQNTTAVLNGAIGGTAAGGDYNYQGGGSGSCAANVLTGGSGVTGVQATGGGAVSWRGVMYSSGNVSYSGVNATFAVASGGAGVGGNSGNAAGVANNGVATAGGGSNGPSPSNAAAGLGGAGPGMLGVNLSPVNTTGVGDGSNITNAHGAGAPGVTSTTAPPASGHFGGTGGWACNTAGSTLTSTPVGWGAGSGGMACFGGALVPGSAGGISVALILY